MSNRLRRWLSDLKSAVPTALSPYWRELPIWRFRLFLTGTFLIAAAAGFCFDLRQLDFPSVGGGLFWPILAGTFAIAGLAAVIKRVRLVPVVWLLALGLGWLGYRAAQ